ncbi:MAG TPA: GMC family oxidoreductase N-terminal domain-containing protein, partial [Actinomycetota bacterium]|nr:GMC family oxidoreductase N-terminal domain-containing protein [Actinomycetota bacterium]
MSSGYDVLVLGGGTAGCVLAGRLSEDPECRVCLVEAGPDYGPFAGGGWPPEMVDAHDLPVSHLWPTDRADRWQHRARILGGCSAHNACVVLEGAPEDYDEWGPGWTYDELAPYLARARDALRARTPEPDQLFPWHRAFLDAGGDDAVLLPVNALGRVRWNAAFAYVDPARDRPNLTILSDTLVDRVVVERGRARGAL